MKELHFHFLLTFLLGIVASTSVANVILDVSTKSQDVEVNTDYRIHIEYIKEQNVTFHIIAKTTGYVGFGLSPNGDMTGADIVIGGLSPDGTPYLKDYHGLGNSAPVEDDEQNYHLLYARQNGTHTELGFTRILTTCDPQDLPFTLSTQKIIWSMGATDKVEYHGEIRGARSVNLLDPTEPADLSKYKFWDMKLTHTVAPKDTSYWCSFFQTPDNFSEPHHIVGFNILLPTPLAVQHTHHLDVYECDPAPGLSPEQTYGPWVGGPGGACYEKHDDPTFPAQHCKRIQFGWAIGGQLIMFPDHAGFPFIPSKYYMTEIHYDNPNSFGNLTFESGMRVYYTNETRTNDAAYWAIGSRVSFTQMLPPNSVNFVHSIQCSPTCTANFPQTGINVFAFLLHAHTAAKSIKVRLWRNGVEQPWLIFDSKYDFNYQQNRLLRQEFKLYPGDHLSAECSYDTRWKKGETTLGGRSTRDEMCQIYFFYYPKIPFVECVSEYPREKLFSFLGLEEVDLSDRELDPIIQKPDKFQGMRLSTMIAQNFSWTTEAREEYQRLHRFTQHEMECFPVDPKVYNASYPEAVDYVPSEECKRTGVDNGSVNWTLDTGTTLLISFLLFLR